MPAAGARTASIQITDNAYNSPQTIGLSATAAVPTIGFGRAFGRIQLGDGFGWTDCNLHSVDWRRRHCRDRDIDLHRSNTRSDACTVPSSVTVSGTTASTVNVSVSTTSRTMARSAAASVNSHGMIGLGGMFAGLLLGMVFVPGMWRRHSLKHAASGVCLGAMVTALMLIASCGGSSSGSGSGTNPNGTLVGTYSLAVTANLNSTTQTVALTLVVQ